MTGWHPCMRLFIYVPARPNVNHVNIQLRARDKGSPFSGWQPVTGGWLLLFFSLKISGICFFFVILHPEKRTVVKGTDGKPRNTFRGKT